MKSLKSLLLLPFIYGSLWSALEVQPAVQSFDTGYTIMKVRDAQTQGTPFIVGASYEGTILSICYDGKVGWTNPLSGYMVHDLWCDDLDGDGIDEILVANADGLLYCLNAQGKLIWKFEPNDGGQLPPMYAVCTIRDSKQAAYVVCGGMDQSFYYLSASGDLIKEVKSTDFSKVKSRAWKGRASPGNNALTVNFLRPMPQADGSDHVILHATNNHMQSTGSLYRFEPLAAMPLHDYGAVAKPQVPGEMRVCDPDGDGSYEIIFGNSDLTDQTMVRFDLKSREFKGYDLKKIGQAGYRVLQPTTIADGESFRYLLLSGNYLITVNSDCDPRSEKKISGTYAYNDLWKDTQGRLLLASSQSGGSCIHIIDTEVSGWEEGFQEIEPQGKIAAILNNAAAVQQALDSYEKPEWQRETLPVYLTWANRKSAVAKRIIGTYDSPVFLDGGNEHKELWDDVHNPIPDSDYGKRRDKRQKYTLTQEQVVEAFRQRYAQDVPGISYWVAHGNDPFMYSLETSKKVLDLAQGKKTVMVWPEMEHTNGIDDYAVQNLFNPLAEYAAQKNANIYFRSKNIFWQGHIYKPDWSEALSGKYANSVVPAMEETTDKTMELSLAGRLGLWTSGAFDAWGMRCSRDNPSFDRARQISYQRLPNHFLRTMVYSLASGSTYLNNTYVDADHMGIALELVAKGALFVPKREEIISFSPVHLSMKEPDEHYLKDGSDVKWTTYYNREFLEKNPFVFSRMNGSWPASPNTEWDFSRYAAGVKDRRQNFLPPYPNGTVMITPPQSGVFADLDAPRGKLGDHLHPIYKDILKEYITDGRHYYSADGKQQYAADTYYKHIAAEIENHAKKLPITVTGDVAWVAAQVSPKHIRLTLVDGGYLNPSDRTAVVQFNTIEPIKITDTLTGESFAPCTNLEIKVPCGMFRFIDIEISEGGIH